MKRIIIISHVIFPRQSPRANRATELAIEFAKKGYQVILYAVLGSYDYTQFENNNNVKVKNIGKMLFSKTNSSDNLKQHKFNKVFVWLFGRVLEFPNIELMFQIPKIFKQTHSKDILISIAQPHPINWGCALAKIRFKDNFPNCWIADCGDPYMFNSFGKPKLFYFKFIEKWFCENANYITVPVPSAVNAYYPEFRNKIKVIPQGFRFDTFNLAPSFPKNEITKFAYAGAIYKEIRDPSAFLEYLCTIKQDFKFIMYTHKNRMLYPFLTKLKGKLIIKDYIPRDELIYELSTMDFLVNFENKSQVQVPSKLIDYALTGRPIIPINNSTFSKKIVNEFLKKDYINKYVVKNLDQYNISNVTVQFESLFL